MIGAGVVPPFGAVAALVWARWSGTSLHLLGLKRPGSWTWTVIGGLAVGASLKLLMKAIVLPLLGAGPTNPAYAQLIGNTPVLIELALTSIFVGGLGEEIFWRGFLFERLGMLLGRGAVQRIIIVVVTSIAFALAHFLEQGVPGVEQAVVTGIVFGTLLARTGVLWPSIVAHAAFDLLSVAIIYANLEHTVAHLVFR